MKKTLDLLNRKINIYLKALQLFKYLSPTSTVISEEFENIKNNISTLSVDIIWNELYNIADNYCKDLNFFQKGSNIYTGFELHQVKDFMYQSITSSIHILSTKKTNKLEDNRHNVTLIHGKLDTLKHDNKNKYDETIILEKGVDTTSIDYSRKMLKAINKLLSDIDTRSSITPTEQYYKNISINYLSYPSNPPPSNKQPALAEANRRGHLCNIIHPKVKQAHQK